MTPRKTFRSRVSVLPAVIIVACFLPVFIPMVRSGNILNPGFYIMVTVLAFIALIFTGIRYVIADGRLTMKMWGVFHESVEISRIVSIKRSRNPLSLPIVSANRSANFFYSPATSLRRLCVCYKKGYKEPYYLISPAREQEFLDTLKEINPNIEIDLGNCKAWYRVRDWDIASFWGMKTERRQIFGKVMIAFCVAVPLIAVALTYREPKMTCDDDGFRVEGLFGIDIRLSDIAITDTITWGEMPAFPLRTGGVSLPGVHRGNFRTKDGAKARLSIRTGSGPVIRIIDHSGKIYYINRKNPNETRTMFGKLRVCCP